MSVPRLRLRVIQSHIQRFHELVDLNRLGEITEESCLETLLNIAGYCVGTECNYRNVQCGRIFGENSQCVDTADTRQIDVHQNDIRARRPGYHDAAVAVPCAQQADIGPACDEILDQHQIGRVV